MKPLIVLILISMSIWVYFIERRLDDVQEKLATEKRVNLKLRQDFYLKNKKKLTTVPKPPSLGWVSSTVDTKKTNTISYVTVESFGGSCPPIFYLESLKNR